MHVTDEAGCKHGFAGKEVVLFADLRGLACIASAIVLLETGLCRQDGLQVWLIALRLSAKLRDSTGGVLS